MSDNAASQKGPESFSPTPKFDTWVCVLLIILILATLAVRYAEQLMDGDLWFHMAYARYMLENRTLVTDHAVFTWTPALQSEIYCAWLGQIILYLLYQAGGLWTLFAARYAVLLVFAGAVAVFARKNGVFLHPLTWLVCLVGLLMSCSAVQIKPEMLSLLFMTAMAYVWWSIKAAPQAKWWCCYLLPAILLVWINSHGGVIFGATFLGVLFLGEVLNMVTSSPETLPPTVRKHFIISLLLCFIAVFLTPYGWEYPVQLLNTFVLSNAEFKKHTMSINAYQSIFYPGAERLYFVDYLVIAVGTLAFALWPKFRKLRFDWTIVVSVLAFGLLYTRYMRTTYFFAPVFAFAVISHLRQTWIRLPFLSGKTSAGVLSAAVMVLCIWIAARAGYHAACTPGYPFGINDKSPIREAEFIREHLSGRKLGNEYDTGAYLLWALWPETKVFIDARYFPFKDWYGEYVDFYTGHNREAFLKKYPCEVLCLTYGFPGIEDFIRSPDWKLVFYGPSAGVFVAANAGFSGMDKALAGPMKGLDVFQAAQVSHFAIGIGDTAAAGKALREMKGVFPLLSSRKRVAARAYNELGFALAAKGHYPEALGYFTDSLRIHPGYSDTYYYLGNILVQQNKVGKGIDNYKQALSLRGDFARAHNNLGNALMLQGELDEAAKHYRRALEITPDYADAQNNLKAALGKKVGIERAIREYEAEAAARPGDIEVLNKLAVLYSRKADFNRSLEYFLKVIAARPGRADTAYNIACSYARMNNVQESLEWLGKAFENGFTDIGLIETDKDLENVRESSGFAAFMEKVSRKN